MSFEDELKYVARESEALQRDSLAAWQEMAEELTRRNDSGYFDGDVSKLMLGASRLWMNGLRCAAVQTASATRMVAEVVASTSATSSQEPSKD